MSLVRPMPLLVGVYERWLVSSRQFFPQVHLAVQPLLRSTVWLKQQRLTHTQSHFTREQRFSPPAQWHLTLSFLQARHSNALPPAGQVVSTVLPVESQAPSPSLAAAVVAQAPGQAPLQLVLQGHQRIDAFTRWHHSSNRAEARVLTIARQVVRQTQRVEERAPGSMALITRQTQATVRQATSTPVTTTEHMAASQPGIASVPTHPWMTNPSPMPAINMEQLTDQVMRQMDRRMTAWRERRGRI
jgi:hypothetical protein